MTWSEIGEIIKAVAPVFTAGAACAAAWIGWRGLEKWRSETLGKRRIELAEEVLADFYEAREIINASRSPGGFSNEGTTRQKGTIETEEDTRTLNDYFVVAERLNKRAKFFARLESRRYRFIAHFGLAAAEPYQELRRIHGEILVAVRMLLMTHAQRTLGSDLCNIKQWESTIREFSEKDPIRLRLDAMVKAIEMTCQPAIQGPQNEPSRCLRTRQSRTRLAVARRARADPR